MKTESLNENMLLSTDSVPDIRITGVNVHLLEAKLTQRFGWSLNWINTRVATLVEVTTDAGLTGWGDGNWGGQRLLGVCPSIAARGCQTGGTRVARFCGSFGRAAAVLAHFAI